MTVTEKTVEIIDFSSAERVAFEKILGACDEILSKSRDERRRAQALNLKKAIEDLKNE